MKAIDKRFPRGTVVTFTAAITKQIPALIGTTAEVVGYSRDCDFVWVSRGPKKVRQLFHPRFLRPAKLMQADQERSQ